MGGGRGGGVYLPLVTFLEDLIESLHINTFCKFAASVNESSGNASTQRTRIHLSVSPTRFNAHFARLEIAHACDPNPSQVANDEMNG